MAYTGRMFRIFVSSTFSDLKRERDALQRETFPRLRDLCASHGARFQAVDLRWGVSEEAGLDQQTMAICLEEIRRSQRVSPRPNFMVLLGDRYGSRLLPAGILAAEFDALCAYLPPAEQERMRIWYRRDDNAVPPEYRLQSRSGRYADRDLWAVIQKELRALLLAGIRHLPTGSYDSAQYLASATEQEIIAGALNVSDACEHVHCFFRSVQGLPADARASDFLDLDASGRPDAEAQARLLVLKQRLRDHLPGNVHDYQASWTGDDITSDHLSSLCDDVFTTLATFLERELTGRLWSIPVDREITEHEVFGAERARHFTGRVASLTAIKSYVTSTVSRPLVVFGAAGTGKSALVARAIEQARTEHPHAAIVRRFIGATPASVDVRALLEGLCRQIARHYGADSAAIPTHIDDLARDFPSYLAQATEERPLIVCLDALDQLGDADHVPDLGWFPDELPPHVRLIASLLPGVGLNRLAARLPTTSLYELGPMSIAESSDLLNRWLEDAGRRLQVRQREEVLGKFAIHGLPLYLKLAFEAARHWASYADSADLQPDVRGLLGQFLDWLATPTQHGALLVGRALGYLAAAKEGLSEDEMLDVLSMDAPVLEEARQRALHAPSFERLPPVLWSRLFFDLEPYLGARDAAGGTRTPRASRGF